MNKIAVNPTQFITCRLCLEELGNYQIIPDVKEQIEYCFGIKVEPFDGLPQLICEKCEQILSNYAITKKKFIDKQNELWSRSSTQGSQEKLSGAQQQKEESQANFEIESNKENQSKLTNRKSSISSSSSNDLGVSKTFRNKITKKRYSTDDLIIKWPESYTKQFVCGICSSNWSTIKSLRNHERKHSSLFKQFDYIFKRNCQVTLYKTDGKNNFTGSTNTVAYSRKKVGKYVNATYHITYTTKNCNKGDDKQDAHEVRKKKSQNTVNNKSHFSSDSSEEELVVKRKRKRRLYSRSSNETVVLDSKSNMSDADEEYQNMKLNQSPTACINLDDSSEDESEKGMDSKTAPEKQLSDNKNSDCKPEPVTITEIITSCRNKYLKKHYQDTNSSKNPSDIANKLQHKIFSIGRKIINKRLGVNCTPLLRFMEHKNLDIAWLPRAIANVSQESNYIRIMPRRKNEAEKLEDNETGWSDYISTQTHSKSNNSEQSHNQLKARIGDSNPESPSVCISDLAVMSDTNLISTETKKLLNANPVANPKQLPKKFATNEVKTAKHHPKTVDHSPQDNNPDPSMPIITSTTSLAVKFSTQEDNNDASGRSDVYINTTDKKAPRIKVKSAAELMSAETLNRMQNPTQSLTQSSIHMPISILGSSLLSLPVQNITIPVSSLPVIMATQNTQPNNTGSLTSQGNILQNEYMILDTIELPNTYTTSPYMYLRKLLQIHNITLLDSNAELSEIFNCLLKFKVMFKQNAQNQPVTLSLGLFCSNNTFCLKVKDRNDQELDITTISPHWQWEVLQVYHGEVANKMLTSAQKIGQKVYEYTNCFLCLLKSIKVCKLPTSDAGGRQ